jgi:hypothetical protein
MYYSTQEEFNSNKQLYTEAFKSILFKRTSSFMNSTGKQKLVDIVPVEKRFDLFGPWEQDPLFGHFKLYLILADNDKDEALFPESWRTDTKVLISKKISNFQ